jgi:hypothetical protein
VRVLGASIPGLGLGLGPFRLSLAWLVDQTGMVASLSFLFFYCFYPYIFRKRIELEKEVLEDMRPPMAVCYIKLDK